MERVILGMSGGTDSSVSALLLQQQGYEVVGVTFRFFEQGGDTAYLEDARAVARQLGFEHRVVDARVPFEEQIIDYFVSDYMRGRTPVPCILCNNFLKWRLLATEGDRLGIDRLATGHYVQRVSYNDRLYIADGADRDKNQAFFLWGMTQPLLQRALFPLGALTKVQVRAIAAQHGLHRAAMQRDSMGVCFCPNDYRPFLRSRVGQRAIERGVFVDTEGRHIGNHEGFPFYTVGQRRGLGQQLNHPMFVQAIDPTTNRITLAPLELMYKQTMRLSGVNVVNRADFSAGSSVTCKIRYRKQETPCSVTFVGEHEAIVRFDLPVNSIANGQAAALYCGNRVLGGGIIEDAY